MDPQDLNCLIQGLNALASAGRPGAKALFARRDELVNLEEATGWLADVENGVEP